MGSTHKTTKRLQHPPRRGEKKGAPIVRGANPYLQSSLHSPTGLGNIQTNQTDLERGEKVAGRLKRRMLLPFLKT